EHLHVDPETGQDRRERVAGVREREERLPHALPPRQLGDAEGEGAEDRQRDRRGDQQLPAEKGTPDRPALELALAGQPGARAVTVGHRQSRTGTSAVSESHSCSSAARVPSSSSSARAASTHPTSSLPFSKSMPN